MKTIFFRLLFACLFLMTLACSHDEFESTTTETPQNINDEAALAAAATGKSLSSECQFEYEGELGPEFWATLCGSDWESCGGSSQSPINIETSTVEHDDDNLEPIQTWYRGTSVDIINNGHTVQFNYDAGSTARLNGIEYELKQFHFHTGSEHTVDNYRYDMEMHLVHQDPNTGLLAVIGVFFKEGRSNYLLGKFLNHIPKNEGEHFKDPYRHFFVNFLLPYDKTYYTYNGSLTTPGCDEIVTWYVLKNPIRASRRQLDAFKKIMHSNYRPVQDLNNRIVRSAGGFLAYDD